MEEEQVQTGVNETPAAEGQNQNQDQQQTPEAIPYERFAEVNDKVKDLEQKVQMSQQQLALYQANMQQPQQQQQPETPDFYDGLDDDDIMTVAQAKQATEAMTQKFQSSLSELQFMVQHPDYHDVVGTPQNLGEPLKNAITQNPQIMTEIRSSPNPMLTAYNYAKMVQKTEQPQTNPAFAQQQVKQQTNPEAQAAINAATKPGSASMAGGGSGFNQANLFANMSDDEFAKYEAEVLSKG